MQPCGKFGYATRQDAVDALYRARARRLGRNGKRKRMRRRRTERSLYRCPFCRLWHLTSWKRDEWEQTVGRRRGRRGHLR